MRKIHSSNWDFLIILDACRFDYFKKAWSRPEKVKRVTSPASETCSWLRRTFPDNYPITLYSANPFINRGELETTWRYHPHEHFQRIVSLWNFLWSAKYGTVTPLTYYKWFTRFVYKQLCLRSQKSILWFLQPHSPYLGKPTSITPSDFVGWHPKKKKGFMDFDFEELKMLYQHNLESALTYVVKLLELPLLKHRKVVITSDHGELLGEYNGKIGHPSNLNVPELRNVPWVEIHEAN